MESNDIPYKDYDHAAKMRKGYAFTIDRDGRWYCHDPNMGEGPIRREALARVFSGAGTGFMAGKGLSVDADGTYWLKSPHDSYKVDVEDVPFVIVDDEQEDGTIVLRTNFDERVALDNASTFIFRPYGPFPDIPYIEIRKGLLARLGRAVLYHLVDHAVERDGAMMLESGGQLHSLGRLA